MSWSSFEGYSARRIPRSRPAVAVRFQRNGITPYVLFNARALALAGLDCGDRVSWLVDRETKAVAIQKSVDGWVVTGLRRVSAAVPREVLGGLEEGLYRARRFEHNGAVAVGFYA